MAAACTSKLTSAVCSVLGTRMESHANLGKCVENYGGEGRSTGPFGETSLCMLMLSMFVLEKALLPSSCHSSPPLTFAVSSRSSEPASAGKLSRKVAWSFSQRIDAVSKALRRNNEGKGIAKTQSQPIQFKLVLGQVKYSSVRFKVKENGGHWPGIEPPGPSFELFCPLLWLDKCLGLSPIGNPLPVSTAKYPKAPPNILLFSCQLCFFSILICQLCEREQLRTQLPTNKKAHVL